MPLDTERMPRDTERMLLDTERMPQDTERMHLDTERMPLVKAYPDSVIVSPLYTLCSEQEKIQFIYIIN